MGALTTIYTAWECAPVAIDVDFPLAEKWVALGRCKLKSRGRYGDIYDLDDASVPLPS